MEILGPAAPVPNDQQLLEMLRAEVQTIISDDIPADTEPERIWALRQSQKADFYWRGIQYISPKFSEGGLINYSAIGSPITGNANGDSDIYDYVINIYRGYGRKFIAVLGARLPNVKAVPDDPDDENMLRLARQADAAANILRNQWDMEMRHMELALQLYKNSTAFIYTPWVTDKEKYGTRKEPKLEARQVKNGPDSWKCAGCGAQLDQPADVCPSCGQAMVQHVPGPTVDAPEVVGYAEYENGRVEFHLCNVFTVACPFWSKDLDDAPWLSYEYDEYKGLLIRMFPELRNESVDSPGTVDQASSQLARQARDAAASPLGIPNPHRQSRWTYRRLWLKTFMYELVKDAEKREMLKQHFPDGLKITTVNGKIMKLENEKLTDVWVCCKPETSEYIYADGIGYDMLAVQDLKNDTTNLAYRTFEGGIGMNFADPRAIDIDQWESRQRVPNEIIGVLPGFGGSLADAFYQVPPAQMNPQTLQWAASIENDGRVAIGTTEAIYGGASSIQETAHQAELQKNASLQQLGITYLYIRKADEAVYTNGVKQLARYASGTMKGAKKSDAGYESIVVDISQLAEDGWHFESEEAFPMTHAERRAWLMWLLGNPQTAQGVGITHPRNAPKNQALLGFSDYYADGVDDHYKAQEVISELVKGAPIKKPMPDGSVDIQPSIPIDDFDNHALMSQEAFAWCKGTAGRRAQKDTMDGFANVVAWGQAHMKASQPPPPPKPPAKLSISAKLGDMMPDQAQEILQDFGVNAPPSPALASAEQGIQPNEQDMAPHPNQTPAPGVAGGPPPPPPMMPQSPGAPGMVQ